MSTVRAILVIGVLLITGCATSNSATPTPEYDLLQLVEDFHAALIGEDLGIAMSYFHEGAVFSQESPTDGATGELLDFDAPGAIRARLGVLVFGLVEIAIHEAEVDGNTVTFTIDSSWDGGARFLSEGYAEFQDGKIIHLFWNLTMEPVE